MQVTEPKLTLQIQGMDCPSCAQTIEAGVSQLMGVTECQLNFTAEKLTVTGGISRQTVIERIEALGYQASDEPDQAEVTSEPEQPLNFLRFLWQRTATRLAVLGALLILPGLIFEELLGQHHGLINLASIGAMLLAGWPVAQSAWRAITLSREININVLMTIAGIGAAIIGAYTEAGMIMVLFAIGEALEGYTATKSRNAIRGLMAVRPNTATRLWPSGEQKRVGLEQLQIGDRVLVKPGESIPMDGRVVAGASAVSQAAITGESRLIDKQPPETVFAGSLNGEGVLEIEVTHLAQDNVISRVIQMVEAAQERRAPAQRFVDQFARYYTPAVVVLAAVVAVVPPLLFGQPFLNPNAETTGWLYRGLALLVVACPCALVISTPVSIISAISNGARNGVLFKGGVYLETLSKIRAIAFDKTGTLTQGKPAVISVRSMACTESMAAAIGQCDECDDVLALANAVERYSEHPLAQAIIGEAVNRGLDHTYPPAQAVMAMTGQGVIGQVGDRQVMLGSHTYFDSHVTHTLPHCQAATADAYQGHTPIMISTGDTYLGTITVADTVRETSREAVARLKQAGLSALVMLTGDAGSTAQRIADQVGLTDVQAELLPQDKVSAVETLQQRYGSVAMVGDGINDAPALATADIGIAIAGGETSTGATTQAMETADITLMSDDLRQLPFALKLSRATMQTIRFNVGLSIGIKLAFLILVLLGTGTMWMAVLADVGTSVLVTLNGMRLLRYRAR